jgi:hypothetical protein
LGPGLQGREGVELVEYRLGALHLRGRPVVQPEQRPQAGGEPAQGIRAGEAAHDQRGFKVAGVEPAGSQFKRHERDGPAGGDAV